MSEDENIVTGTGMDPREDSISSGLDSARETSGEGGTDAFPAPASNKGAVSRRTFVAGFGGLAALAALGAVRFVGEETLVRPPGGQDFDVLIARCLRCGKCMEACPEQVIVMTHIEDGIVTQRMPQMSFKSSYCTWCEGQGGSPLCVSSCPTNALELSEGADARNTVIGKAEINASTCLAYRDIGCRFCYDACPYEAMKLDEHNRPAVIEDLCNGCGACKSVCVSLQDTSISSSTEERAVIVRPFDANTAYLTVQEGGVA